MNRDEVIRWGYSQPVYRFHGAIIDGRKVAAAAARLGVSPPLQVDFENEDEARFHLGLVHPERALQRWPSATAREAAEKFGVPLRRVARFFQPPPAPKRKRAPRRRTGAQTRGKAGGSRPINLYLSDALHKTVNDNAASLGVPRSVYVRAAIAACPIDDVRAKIIAMTIASTAQSSSSSAIRS